MAKWKNVALLTTLVMPMAMATGTTVANASADVPEKTTIKIHKQNRTDTSVIATGPNESYFFTADGDNLADGQHYFWGDGSVQNEDTQKNGSWSSNNPFDWQNMKNDTEPDGDYAGIPKNTWADKWNPMEDIRFYAIHLPDNVLTYTEDGTPKISNGVAFTYEGKDILWSDFLTANHYPQPGEGSGKYYPKHDFNSMTGTDQYGMKHTKNYSSSGYSIDYNDVNGLTEDQLREILLDKYPNTYEITSAVNGDDVTDGVATFKDLANGNWLFMEDATTGQRGQLAATAVPMFVATPYLQPTQTEGQDNGDHTWYDNTEEQAMHIYAKNYSVKGDITVLKKDGETGKALSGVQFSLMILNEKAKAAVQEAIAGGLLLQDDKAKIVSDLQAIIKNADDGSEYLKQQSTGSNGKTKFEGLELGKTYQVLETGVPAGYQIQPELKDIYINTTLETADDDTDAGDGIANPQGDTYTVDNFDSISLDKDIYIGPVAADELKVSGFENDGETPIYADSVTGDTYMDNDTQYGVSRGGAYSYTINAELNKNVGSYSQFSLVDDVPYQVNLNSWTMYVQVDGKLTPLLQAVDNQGNVNDHSTNDGIANESVSYDSNLVTEDGHRSGVSYKFAEGAEAFAESLGYTGEFGKSDAALMAQTNFVADHLMHMHGYSGSYEFDSNYHSVMYSANGEMNLDFQAELLQGLQQFISADKTGKTSLVFKMNAQTNSAAQANKDIDNKATLNYNPYSEGTQAPASLSDTAATSASGWDILKTDEDGNPLKGAGFNLGREVTPENVEKIITQLIGQKNDQGQYVNNGNVMSDDTLELLGDKIGTTGDRAAKIAAAKTYLDGQADDLRNRVNNFGGEPVYVWFTHLMAPSEISGTAHGNLQPIFGTMEANMQMGDIYWTTDERLSTTHVTSQQGYIQYCGLADGHYVLSEAITPGGYSTMNDTLFTLAGASDSYYAVGNPGYSADYPLINEMGTDDEVTGPNADGEMEGNYAHLVNEKQKQSIFPITGGAGILGMLAAGLATMGSAVTFWRRQG